MNSLPVIESGIYRHNKTGHLYDVIGVALQTESDEPLVVYRSLYSNEFELFARPYIMFIEDVKLNGEIKPRFEKTNE